MVVGPNQQSMACPASLFWAAKNRGNLALINLQGKAFQKPGKATVISKAEFNEGREGWVSQRAHTRVLADMTHNPSLIIAMEEIHEVQIVTS